MIGSLYLGLGDSAFDFVLWLMRMLTGSFFVLYRFRWVWDPSQPEPWFCVYRRDKLRGRLLSCGFSPIWAAPTAIVEILAGLALIVGLLTVPAAIGLLTIMVFANLCTPREEIAEMRPVDCVDWLACYLRLVEPLYTAMALMIALAGPGKWSLDYLIWSMMRWI